MLQIDDIRPLAAKILVKLYTKPQSVKGIILPDAFRDDETQSLWEVVRCGPKVEEVVGIDLEADDIVQTPPWSGVFVDGGGDRPRYFMIEAASVVKAFRYR